MTQQIHPMERIKAKLAVITDSIPRGSSILYLDYPVHDNIGDQLILQGTEAFFRDYDIHVHERYCYLHFPKRRDIPSDWIVVCHGGGNFGDLYPYYQQFREFIIERYPLNRIVILPQTVHFQSPEEMEKSLAICAQHRDLHLYVRDEVSYAQVAGKLKNVVIAPDMAHQLFPIRLAKEQGDGTLGIIRTDKEAAKEAGQTNRNKYDLVTDWPQLLGLKDWYQLRLIWKLYKLDRLIGTMLPLKPLWYWYSRKLVNKAIRLYSNYDHVVTSRLHGHILACLMNKPNELIDNAYGKNESYYRAWTHRVSNARAVPRTGLEDGDQGMAAVRGRSELAANPG